MLSAAATSDTPVESEDVTADATCPKLVCVERRKHIRLEAGETRQFDEWIRPGMRQIVPSDHQHAAGSKALEASPERLFELAMRIDPPAGDAVAKYEVENLDAKMAPQVLHAIDEVPGGAIACFERVEVEGPEASVTEKLRIRSGVPAAAHPQDVAELPVLHDVGKDRASENFPVGEVSHQRRAPGAQGTAEKLMVEIAHDLGQPRPRVRPPCEGAMYRIRHPNGLRTSYAMTLHVGPKYEPQVNATGCANSTSRIAR